MNQYYLAAFTGVILVTVAQLLLKKGAVVAREGHGTWYKFYNAYTLSGYFTFTIVTVLNLYALRGIQLIEMVFIIPLSYLLVVLTSTWFFGERLNRQQWIGLFILLAGVLIFNLR